MFLSVLLEVITQEENTEQKVITVIGLVRSATKSGTLASLTLAQNLGSP